MGLYGCALTEIFFSFYYNKVFNDLMTVYIFGIEIFKSFFGFTFLILVFLCFFFGGREEWGCESAFSFTPSLAIIFS